MFPIYMCSEDNFRNRCFQDFQDIFTLDHYDNYFYVLLVYSILEITSITFSRRFIDINRIMIN